MTEAWTLKYYHDEGQYYFFEASSVAALKKKARQLHSEGAGPDFLINSKTNESYYTCTSTTPSGKLRWAQRRKQ